MFKRKQITNEYIFYLGSHLYYIGSLGGEDIEINERRPTSLEREERGWITERHTTNKPEETREKLLLKYNNVFVVLFEKRL